MADFDFSMAVTADGDQAVGEISKLEGAIDGVAASERNAAAAASNLQSATAGAEAGSRRLAAAQTEIMRSGTQAAAAEKQIAAAAVQASQAIERASTSVKQHRAAYTQLGFQIQDITSTLALGISPLTVLAQQGGQTASALQLMGGTAGKVGTFFAGPWGSILIAATAVLGHLTAGLFENAQAEEDAAKAADSFGNAQSLLGQIIDLTTGKLKTQNKVLIETIRLQAEANLQKARGEEQQSRAELAQTPTNLSAGDRILRGLQRGGFKTTGSFDAPELRKLLTDVQSGNADATTARQRLAELESSGRLAGQTFDSIYPKILRVLRAGNDIKANQDAIDAIDGKGVSSDLVPFSRDKKTPKGRKAAKGPDLGEFGSDTANRIQDITAQFTNLASQQVAVARATRQIDDLIDDLQKKKPPNFEELIKQAQEAKVLIKEGINKPFNDFIDAQQQQVTLGNFVLRGLDAQADAHKQIVALEKQMGPLTAEQKDQILLGVEALKEQQRELDILCQKQQSYLTAVDEMRSAVRGVFTDGAKGILDLPKRLLNAFVNLQADVLTEKLFGDVFRQLQDKITGQDIVKGAAREFAATVKAAKPPVNELASSATKAANALDKLAGSAGGASTPAGTASIVSAGQGLGTDNKGGSSKSGINSTTGPAAEGADIIVNAVTKDLGNKVKDVRSLIDSPQSLFNEGLKGIASKILGPSAGKAIGEFGGKAFAGAAVGQLTNSFLAPIGKALGFKTSKTGAQIGGAIGSFLPIPGGEIIGSIIGSVVGGLFKKTKTGTATIGNVNGQAGVTGTAGNSSGLKKVAEGLAGAVGDSLGQIADSLGGQIGNFSVSIGQRNKKFVVDPTGQGRTKGSGVQKFKTEEEAQAAALQEAIGQGAIAGISAAVSRALKSSSDVSKAVKEALKVQEVENLINGLGGTLERQFRAFEAQAKERVRIATQYGFDVTKIEKINAEERVKLVDELLTSRIGALQDLLKEFNTGDLFEGDAKQRRAAILAEITKARAQVDSGVQGAGDTLAGLLRQLATTSRDAFGTAGPEYASDRQTAISNATAVIEAERKRIADAQAAVAQTNAALATNNNLTNETNGLLAQNNTLLQQLIANLGGSTNGNLPSGVGLTLRLANLGF